MQYVLPVSLVFLATGMLTLKGLRRQGRLGRLFGMVTIRDQPSSNTIQKIIAVKDAMQDLESCLQNVNVVLLKLRTIVLSGHPQVCYYVLFTRSGFYQHFLLSLLYNLVTRF